MNPKFCNHSWTGPTVTDGNSACASCEWCRISYFDFINGIIPKEPKPTVPVNSVYYFWLGGAHGYYISSDKNCPVKGGKLKCMGFTSDIGWPKRMNTGRLMHKPKEPYIGSKAQMKKLKQKRKKLSLRLKN